MRRLINPRRVTLIAIAGVGLTATLAIAGTAPGRKIGQGTGRGDYAVASAGATARHPRALYLRVVSRPKQRVNSSYSLTCGKRYGAGSKSGNFSGYGIYVRRMRMNYARPDVCYIGATAQLRRSGFLKLQIYKK